MLKVKCTWQNVGRENTPFSVGKCDLELEVFIGRLNYWIESHASKDVNYSIDILSTNPKEPMLMSIAIKELKRINLPSANLVTTLNEFIIYKVGEYL